MRDYLNRIKICCDTLGAAGEKVSKDNQILHILSGLGPEYNPVMISLTSRVEPPSLREVHGLLLVFENRLETIEKIGLEVMSPSVNMATQTQQNRDRTQENFRPNNGRGRGPGSFRSNNGRGRGGKFGGNWKPRCQICHIIGHTADKCYERSNLSYSPANKHMNQNDQFGGTSNGEPSAHMAHMRGSQADGHSEVNWYPDSGANNHVTYDLANLNEAGAYQGEDKVQIGNDTGLKISHIGHSIVKPILDQSHHAFVLKSLLYVPQIKKNMLSVSQFARENSVFFEFYPSFCLVKDQATGATLLKGKVDKGLYSFTLTSSSPMLLSPSRTFQPKISHPAAHSTSLANKSNLTLWHLRFGHASFNIVRKALVGSTFYKQTTTSSEATPPSPIPLSVVPTLTTLDPSLPLTPHSSNSFPSSPSKSVLSTPNSSLPQFMPSDLDRSMTIESSMSENSPVSVTNDLS
ncbi:hypothetical protein C2S53_014734 [Perilla frutescens var. hirtella]|uniref:Retrovirus-related Pol polyprotein from transposon TNT 1-94-like beta-barrel domain-containing protein n=1 Tax=Perilla frutescens var. hirtella TaxID=608512 RepID=A0AAD4P9G2_PERFH|nr:hypothetical protein C2S53_014734 [Perilla frutescens var. hirtella]